MKSRLGRVWYDRSFVGPDGERLHRLPGHIAYWFAWNGYLGDEGEVAEATN